MNQYFLPAYTQSLNVIYNPSTKTINGPVVAVLAGLILILSPLEHWMSEGDSSSIIGISAFLILIHLWIASALAAFFIQSTLLSGQDVTPLPKLLSSTSYTFPIFWLVIKFCLVGLVLLSPFYLLLGIISDLWGARLGFFLALIVLAPLNLSFVKAALGKPTKLREGYQLLKDKKKDYFLNYILIFLPYVVLSEIETMAGLAAYISFSQLLLFPTFVFAALFYRDEIA